MDKYDTVSPLDFRYYAKKKVFENLQPYLSERAFVRYLTRVETALTKVLAEKGICSNEVAEEIRVACNSITIEEMVAEEQRIKHNIRALVNCIRNKVSNKAKPYVHLTATSHDIICTAEVLRLKEVTKNVILPELQKLQQTLITIALREKATVQIGRTHGQHAVPITFGFTISGYVARLGECIKRIDYSTQNLRGKMAGAVGAYNASSLFFDNPEAFEVAVLQKLNLRPAAHATQIVPPEYVLTLTHHIIQCYGILAQIADDMRHLQRSEINEVAEIFGRDQVGSSTMPHKRNPINFENVKSMWKAIMPRLTTLYIDQISEHQRDLTNSASSRFIPEIYAAFTESVIRLQKQMEKLVVDKEGLMKNFNLNKNMITAEPLYILLSHYGHPNAHEAVRKLTLQSQKTGIPVFICASQNTDLRLYLQKMNNKQIAMLKNPVIYIGKAIEKTEKICTELGEKYS
jgi:adenylosuccinate lyase